MRNLRSSRLVVAVLHSFSHASHAHLMVLLLCSYSSVGRNLHSSSSAGREGEGERREGKRELRSKATTSTDSPTINKRHTPLHSLPVYQLAVSVCQSVLCSVRIDRFSSPLSFSFLFSSPLPHLLSPPHSSSTRVETRRGTTHHTQHDTIRSDAL